MQSIVDIVETTTAELSQEAKAGPRVAFGVNLLALLAERGLSIGEFCKLVYGVNAKGEPRGSGGVYPILKGEVSVSAGTIKKFAKGLDVPVAALEALKYKPYPAGAAHMAPKHRGEIMQGARLVRPPSPQAAPDKAPAPAPAPLPQLGVTMGQDGRATLRAKFDAPGDMVVEVVIQFQATCLPRSD
jgi:hypothetical protein